MTPSLAIRFAMLVGVLMLGGVTWFVRAQGIAIATSASPAALVLAGRVIWIVALAGCVALFMRLQRARTAPEYLTKGILGWALGEMVALYGGIVFYLTGVSLWYFLGLGFLVLTFLAFPARPPS